MTNGAKVTWDLVPTQIWQIVSQPAEGQKVRAASRDTSEKEVIIVYVKVYIIQRNAYKIFGYVICM